MSGVNPSGYFTNFTKRKKATFSLILFFFCPALAFISLLPSSVRTLCSDPFRTDSLVDPFLFLLVLAVHGLFLHLWRGRRSVFRLKSSNLSSSLSLVYLSRLWWILFVLSSSSSGLRISIIKKGSQDQRRPNSLNWGNGGVTYDAWLFGSLELIMLFSSSLLLVDLRGRGIPLSFFPTGWIDLNKPKEKEDNCLIEWVYRFAFFRSFQSIRRVCRSRHLIKGSKKLSSSLGS